MVKIGIGLDVGADSAKVVTARMMKNHFVPLKAALLKKEEGKPYSLGPFIDGLGIRGESVLGVTGKEMIIRYTHVAPMPDWQLKQVMGFEIDDLAAQSGGGLSADFNRVAVSSSLSDDDTILLALVKNSLLNEQLGMLESTRLTVAGFTPNAVALYNLLSMTADVDSGISLVLDIGAENIDMTIIQDGALIFARNLSGGSNLFDTAIMESFNVRPAKAGKLKKEMGSIISRNAVEGLSPQEEKISRVLSNAAGQIYSMIQSSLLFCKAQIRLTELSLDRVYLTGGGPRSSGLDKYLLDNLDVPVKLYDPAEEVDITRLDNAAEFSENGMEFSCAMALALMSATTDHYSIRILPEEVKKRQFFKNHTVFGILAAVVLVVFMGIKLYFAMGDAQTLDRDISKRRSELQKREKMVSEIEGLQEENSRLVSKINILEMKIIPTTGVVRTFAMVQKYLPGDLWITSIDVERVELEQLGDGAGKVPVIRVRGSGREKDQPLQRSFTDFRKKLESDPLITSVVPQVRYGDDFVFSLLINYTSLSGGETDGDSEESGEEQQ